MQSISFSVILSAKALSTKCSPRSKSLVTGRTRQLHFQAGSPETSRNFPPPAYSAHVFDGKPLAHAIDRHFRQSTFKILRLLNVGR